MPFEEKVIKPYIPEPLPLNLDTLNWQAIAAKVGEASAALAYYNGILRSIPNPAIFLSPLEIREAVFSSHIEGTMATVDEVLRYEANLKPESLDKQDDIVEVLNYRNAVRSARDWLSQGWPFNLTLICAIHKELLQGVRGQDKHPGELRNDQVWVGAPGSVQIQASYMPPEPLSLPAHMANLVLYMNYPDPNYLVQTAIVHAQFEIIHPFDDGNGRTGRILIPLFLWCKKRISSPMFYISEYFDDNRPEYYHRLHDITAEHNWQDWIQFFLNAITVQSSHNAVKASQVLDLYHEVRNKLSTLSKSPAIPKVLDTLFISPIFKPAEFIKLAGIDVKSGYRVLAVLKQNGILQVLRQRSGRTGEVMKFVDLYNLVR